jgi:hypothetical protein
VLSTSTFTNAYVPGSELANLLHQLFKYETIVFVGCSLSEPPIKKILERARVERQKFVQQNGFDRYPDHLILSADVSERSKIPGPSDDQRRSEDEEFRPFGIQVVRYSKVAPTDHSTLKQFLINAGRLHLPPLKVTDPHASFLGANKL